MRALWQGAREGVVLASCRWFCTDSLRVSKSRGSSDNVSFFLFLQGNCSASFLSSHMFPETGDFSYRVPQRESKRN